MVAPSPLTFGTEGIVISGLLEPAYEVGGDSFDYAVNGDLAHFGLFDMMGHGLEAASLSSVVIGAYRSARRKLLDLPETYVQIDRTLVELTGGERGFATGLLAELRLDEGVLRFISAGHLSPLLLREGKVVKSLIARPALPFGFANLDTSGRSPEEVPVSSNSCSRAIESSRSPTASSRRGGEWSSSASTVSATSSRGRRPPGRLRPRLCGA